MSQNTTPAHPQNATQPHGLDLVREVLFGADKRHASEEFATLKAQIAALEQKFQREASAAEQKHAQALSALATEMTAHVKQLETQMGEHARRGADALASARAALEAQQQAQAKMAADQGAAADAKLVTLVANLRRALDAFSATPGAK